MDPWHLLVLPMGNIDPNINIQLSIMNTDEEFISHPISDNFERAQSKLKNCCSLSGSGLFDNGSVSQPLRQELRWLWIS